MKRAPIYLRAVVNKKTGEKDVLDQLEDMPSEDEMISVYKRQGDAGHVHGELDGEPFRDKEAWQTWAGAQVPSA